MVKTKANNYINQLDMFSINSSEVKKEDIVIKKLEQKITKEEILEMEKEVLSMYVSGHPLDSYMSEISKINRMTIYEVSSLSTGENVDKIKKYEKERITICGMISKKRLMITKSGKEMMFLELEDETGTIEVVLFSKVYLKYANDVNIGDVIKIIGNISIKDDEPTNFIAQTIDKIDKENKIYIKLPKDKFEFEDIVIKTVENMEDEFRGNVPVYIFYEGTNKLKLLKRAYWLNSNNYTINELSKKFGSENVKLK